MKIGRNLVAAFAVISALFAASAAIAGTTANGPGPAVHGHDVVAYFTDGRPHGGHGFKGHRFGGHGFGRHGFGYESPGHLAMADIWIWEPGWDMVS